MKKLQLSADSILLASLLLLLFIFLHIRDIHNKDIETAKDIQDLQTRITIMEEQHAKGSQRN